LEEGTGLSEELVFTSVKTSQSLVKRVVDELQGMIVDGELKPGMHLPSQNELAKRLGVSRTVIREAVGILVTKGLLESKHGVGMIVCKIDQAQIVAPLVMLLKTKGITIDDLFQVRSIIEVEIAGLAAKSAKPPDIIELRSIVDEMATISQNPLEYVRLDDKFHRMLASMSENPLLVVLSDSIRDILQEIRLAVSGHPDLAAITRPDHVRILEGIVDRDIDGARKAMLAHLENAKKIQENILNEWSIEKASMGDLEGTNYADNI
jgi:GntR family transcriptional repressor for pyruvate dehydrogenase complex